MNNYSIEKIKDIHDFLNEEIGNQIENKIRNKEDYIAIFTRIFLFSNDIREASILYTETIGKELGTDLFRKIISLLEEKRSE